MPHRSPPSFPNRKSYLLSQVIELLRGELVAISDRDEQDLPEIKKKKVSLASHLLQLDAAVPDSQAPASLLKVQISGLETESRAKIESHLKLLGNQILALQELSQYWRESLNVSFRQFYEGTPSPP